MTLKVATYNVHRCVGPDRRRDPGRVLAVLRELGADVVALQELEWQPAAALDLLEDFARDLACSGIAGPTLTAQSGHYGNAVLSRLPVRNVRRVDLTVLGREPRGALDLLLESPRGDLQVIATHLGLGVAERREQVRRILALIPPDRARPVVLMGDLNEWFLWGRPVRWLRAHFGRAPAPASFPARFPLLALDRIWVEPVELRRDVRVHFSELARAASDHLPISTTLAM